MSKPQILFDTNALFDIYKGRRRIRSHFDQLLDGEIEGYISAISVAEMWRGIRPDEISVHEALLELFTVLPLNVRAAKQAGLWMQRYQASGLGWMDALIVATAHQHHLQTLTRDAKLTVCLADEAVFNLYSQK